MKARSVPTPVHDLPQQPLGLPEEHHPQHTNDWRSFSALTLIDLKVLCLCSRVKNRTVHSYSMLSGSGQGARPIHHTSAFCGGGDNQLQATRYKLETKKMHCELTRSYCSDHRHFSITLTHTLSHTPHSHTLTNSHSHTLHSISVTHTHTYYTHSLSHTLTH